MRKRFVTFLVILGSSFLGSHCFDHSSAFAEELSPSDLRFFETKIRPVLVKECYSCHSNKTGNAKGGLRLDTRELTHIGGESGPAIVPHELDESLLYNAISHQDFAMPPRKKLSSEVVNDFRMWIEMGAPDPRATAPSKFNSSISSQDIASAKSEFWSFQSPRLPKRPRVQQKEWPANSIDYFVLEQLEKRGLQPSADAQAHVLLRRLCFDLIGLPPTPQQIEYFEKEWKKDPDKAVRFVVERLLDSKLFGERWGRHWLDVARFAESTGREVNMTYPHAWRYRDYVIDSFNEDKPYDRFVQEQIAGDLLPVKTDQQWADNLIATGFLVLGPKALSEQNRVQFSADLADEQLDTTTRVILGMSVACARCHDHKFDPIPQTDYYAMVGIFRNMESFYGSPASKFGNLGGVQNRNRSNLLSLPVDDPTPYETPISRDELKKLSSELQSTIRQISDYRRQRRNPQMQARSNANQQFNINRLTTRAEYLSAKLGGYEDDGTPISLCMGVQEPRQMRDVRLLIRGEIDQPAQTVERNVPRILRDRPLSIEADSSGRLEMARWMTSKKNPLTARVMVNRVWQHLMGDGIVGTTENFGMSGSAPSHEELLDYLAVKFMESGWSVKQTIRQIVSSRVYRQSSSYDESKFNIDPDNRFYWRASPRRLDAESIRDSMLFVSGQLDVNRPAASEVAKAGYMRVRNGNLVNPGEFATMGVGMMSGGRVSLRDRFRQADEITKSRFLQLRSQMMSGNKLLDVVDAKYRSVYLPVVRDNVPRSLEVFDLPDSSIVSGKRETSNTANQALYLMNNALVLQQSEAFARRLASSSSDFGEQVSNAYLLAFGRKPELEELESINKYRRESNVSRKKQLNTICQSFFASAEFRYLD